MYAYKNMTPSEIGKYLDSLNIKPLKSENWSASSIRDILSNPTYIGKIKWKDRKVVKVVKNGKVINTQPKNRGNDIILVNGLHPAIIDEKTFNIVQKKRKDNSHAPIPGTYIIQNPLSGIIRCAKCKRAMCRVTPITLACINPKCDNISSNINVVEKKVIDGLKEWLNSYENEINNTSIEQTNINDIINMKQSHMKKIRKDISEYDNKIERVHDFLENGVYTIDVFTERKNKILKQKQELINRYSELEQELDDIRKIEQSKKELIPKTKDVLAQYMNCNNPKTKNDLLKSVIEKAEYLKTHKCFNQYGNPENFELLIYPKF